MAERMGDWVRRVDDDGRESWWRDRVTTGPYELSFRLDYMAEVLTFSLMPDEMPGWRVDLEHRLVDGRVRLVRQEAVLVDADADPSPLYRKVGGRNLEGQITQELRQDMVRMLLPPRWQDATLKKRRTGRRPVTPLELAETVALYRKACEDSGGKPMPLLAKRHNLNVNTVQGHLRKAEKLGIFTGRDQGKAGGDLTEYGRALIAEKEAKHGKR